MSVEADDGNSTSTPQPAPKPKRKWKDNRAGKRPMSQRRARKGGQRGIPPFEPTAEQRTVVAALTGLRMSWEEIRLLVHNPHTGEPIAKTTFAKAFRKELREGGPKLKSLISSRYYQALAEGRDWAIRAGLKNRFGWVFEGQPAPSPAQLAEGETPPLQVTFVLPSGRNMDAQPVDVTPEPPPDYSRKALPPPPERRRGPLGWLEEKPPEPTDWLK
jgi:hypothetical protein